MRPLEYGELEAKANPSNIYPLFNRSPMTINGARYDSLAAALIEHPLDTALPVHLQTCTYALRVYNTWRRHYDPLTLGEDALLHDPRSGAPPPPEDPRVPKLEDSLSKAREEISQLRSALDSAPPMLETTRAPAIKLQPPPPPPITRIRDAQTQLGPDDPPTLSLSRDSAAVQAAVQAALAKAERDANARTEELLATNSEALAALKRDLAEKERALARETCRAEAAEESTRSAAAARKSAETECAVLAERLSDTARLYSESQAALQETARSAPPERHTQPPVPKFHSRRPHSPDDESYLMESLGAPTLVHTGSVYRARSPDDESTLMECLGAPAPHGREPPATQGAPCAPAQATLDTIEPERTKISSAGTPDDLTRAVHGSSPPVHGSTQTECNSTPGSTQTECTSTPGSTQTECNSTPGSAQTDHSGALSPQSLGAPALPAPRVEVDAVDASSRRSDIATQTHSDPPTSTSAQTRQYSLSSTAAQTHQDQPISMATQTQQDSPNPTGRKQAIEKPCARLRLIGV